MGTKKHPACTLLPISLQNENIFFSPASIYLCLSMTACGSEDQTQKEFKEVLDYQNSLQLGKQISSLNYILLQSSQQLTILSANKIYTGVSGISYNCKKFIYDNFSTGFEQVNFQETEKVRLAINKWVSEQTNTKIDELLKKDTISDQTKMVLVNALYFKAGWLHSFNDAQDNLFYLQPGNQESVVSVKMMFSEADYKYGKFKNFEYLQIPYKNDAYALEVFLPTVSIKDLEDTLTDEKIIKAQKNSQKIKVRLLLPRFKMDGSPQDVISILKQLGINEAFTNMANFKQFSEVQQLVISNVIHQALIEVNEQGTVAVAAPAVVMKKKTCIQILKIQDFYCNKPFVFSISHIPSNTVLFMGKIINPTNLV